MEQHTFDIAAIEQEGRRIIEFGRGAPDQVVPQYPTWTLRDLVVHVAGVHGRTAAVCQTLAQERIPTAQLPVAADPFDWAVEQLDLMLEALRMADPDSEVWTFVPSPRLAFWERRMAIETGVHRWDAQGAVEDPEPLLPLVARHGLDEFPDLYLPRLGEVPTLGLIATDLGRTWRFGDDEPVASVEGTASDLFLRLMSRPGTPLPEAWEAAVDALGTPAETTTPAQVPPTSHMIDNATGLYLEGIRDGRPREAIAKYSGARYTQHSTGVRDGQAGFIEFFEPFIERNPVRDIQVIRALEDGCHIFLHVYQSLNDGESEWVTTDFFDTDDEGRIVEHWDVIAAYAPRTPSGHTSIDGATQITDLDQTAANKALVRNLIEDVLMEGGDPSAVDHYISADGYIQHSAEIEDGLAAFRPLALAADRRLVYDEIVLLVGQGNFVATLCRARREGDPFAQVDLFRLEHGLVVEHWDNAEAVPPRDEWANSGKF